MSASGSWRIRQAVENVLRASFFDRAHPRLRSADEACGGTVPRKGSASSHMRPLQRALDPAPRAEGRRTDALNGGISEREYSRRAAVLLPLMGLLAASPGQR